MPVLAGAAPGRGRCRPCSRALAAWSRPAVRLAPPILRMLAACTRREVLGRHGPHRRDSTERRRAVGRGTLARDESKRRTSGGPRARSPIPSARVRPSAPDLPDHYRLSAAGRAASIDLARGPGHPQDPAGERAPPRRPRRRPRRGRRALAAWRPGERRRGRGPVHARAGDAPGLHRRAGRRRPRGDARRDGRARRRPRARQPARPRRPRDRPLGPGRRCGDAARVRVQRRARVRAQRRALPAAALGADGVPRPAGRAARAPASSTRSTSSTWPRSSTAGADDDGRGRLPGHARRDRLAHDDGQRARRARLRRRRDRGRGRAARPAALPADAAGRRRAADRRAAARLDRDGPRAGRHRDAPRVRRRRGVRRVRRRRAGRPGAGRPGDDLEHEPRVRGDGHAVPDRRRDARLPAADRPRRERVDPRRALRQGAGPVARARAGPGVRRRCSSSTWRPWCRRSPGRGGRRTAFPSRSCARTSGRTSRPASNRRGGAAAEPPEPGQVEASSAESFPASDAPSFSSARRRPRTAPSTVADAGRASDATARSRSRSTATEPWSGPARSPSPRSPRARTPRTRRSWSAPGCSPGTRSRAA